MGDRMVPVASPLPVDSTVLVGSLGHIRVVALGGPVAERRPRVAVAVTVVLRPSEVAGAGALRLPAVEPRVGALRLPGAGAVELAPPVEVPAGSSVPEGKPAHEVKSVSTTTWFPRWGLRLVRQNAAITLVVLVPYLVRALAFFVPATPDFHPARW